MDQAIDFKRSIQQAKNVAEGGDLSRAIALADAVLAKYPYEQDGWMLRSALFHLSKNYEQALDDVKRAIKMNPRDSFLHYTHGWMVYELTRYDEATNYFSKAIDLYGVHRNDCYSEGLHFMRAEAFLKLGDSVLFPIAFSHGQSASGQNKIWSTNVNDSLSVVPSP
jgi:Tfp pilus assembly protein PilF